MGGRASLRKSGALPSSAPARAPGAIARRAERDPRYDQLVQARTWEGGAAAGEPARSEARAVDIYFSADVETDGPIPGPYSMLSFAMVVAGRFDGTTFTRPTSYEQRFEVSIRPISPEFEAEALAVNGLDRDRLMREGADPVDAMTRAERWVRSLAGDATPVLVAYPLSFDWTWLYWYFTRYAKGGSPFEHSRCFDLKTAYAVKAGRPIVQSGRRSLPPELRAHHPHTHRAIDDAIEQAEIFANLFEWKR